MAAPRGPRAVAILLGSALLVALVVMLWPAPETTSSAGDPSKASREPEIPAEAITAPGALQERREAQGRNELPSPSTKPDVDDAADPSLIIQVCDHAGTPLPAVPVALRAGDGTTSATLWRGQTAGADGLARVPRPRALLQSTGEVAAVVALPIRPVPMARLAREALPLTPVKLTLPPTGQIVAWIDDLPADQAEAVTVTLTAARTAEAEASPLEASAHPHQGAGTFPFVGLGLSLVVRARRAGQNEGDRVPILGPTGAGEVVHVHLRVNPAGDRVMLLMHLQDQAGRALRNRHVMVALELRGRGSISSSGFDLDADAEGVLRLVTDENFRTLPERSLRLRSQAEAAGETTEALVNVPGALASGENDLGAVTMLPPPLVCSGMVVDHAGKPIADADLRVFARPTGGARDPQEVRGVSGHSDGTGRFTMRGSTPRTDLLLTATAAGYQPRNDVPFLPGAEGLRLELEAAAALVGSVRLDEVVQAPDVLVTLDAGSEHRTARVQVNGRLGGFRFDSVAPGIATVAVRLVGEPTGLLLPGLQLPPGEVTRDPRLQDVDLSKGRRAVHFTVVEADGSLAKDARVAVLNAEGQRSFEGYRLSSGKGRIVTQRSPLEVLVFAAGHRYVRVPDLLDDSTVTLPPALRVRLQLPAGCPAPAAPFRLEVRLDARTTAWPDNGSWRFFEGTNGEHSGDGTLPWIQGGRAVCDAGGEAVVPVPEPGSWGVAWRLSRHQGDDRVDRWIANDPAAITVSDVAGEQLVTAGLRAEQLEAARARLEGR